MTSAQYQTDLLALSDERDLWLSRLLSAERAALDRGYRRGYADGYARQLADSVPSDYEMAEAAVREAERWTRLQARLQWRRWHERRPA